MPGRTAARTVMPRTPRSGAGSRCSGAKLRLTTLAEPPLQGPHAPPGEEDRKNEEEGQERQKRQKREGRQLEGVSPRGPHGFRRHAGRCSLRQLRCWTRGPGRSKRSAGRFKRRKNRQG